ncbi:MAG: hypothetical protein KAT26_11545 [Marinosulfonomonas sp.]|nr:hypothetical protein [Marinosulfonomonas sp.]
MTKTNKSTLFVSVFLLFAACSTIPKIEVTRPVMNVTPTSAAAAERFRKGYSELTFRATVSKDGKPVEVSGARCTLKNDVFNTSFVSPSTIRIPTIKGKPRPMRVTCAINGNSGYKDGTPHRRGKIVTGTGRVGVLATLVSAAVVAGIDLWEFGEPKSDFYVPMGPPNKG